MSLPTAAPQLDPPAAERPPRANRARTAATIAVGVGLLAFLLHHAGLDQVLVHLRTMGWAAPLVVGPYLFIALVDALGWRRTLHTRVPLHALYLIRMAGEAVNSVTPTATLGGEPLKAYLLRHWGVPGSEGLASLVIARTALTLSQSLFVVLGIAALFVRMGRPTLGAAWMVGLLGVTAGLTFTLVHFQSKNPAGVAWRMVRRLAPRSRRVARFESVAAAIDERLADFYRIERHSFAQGCAWHFLGWLLGVGEVLLFMWLIGSPIGWLDALVIEALGQPIRAVAIIIPGGIGAQEVGGVALCKFLGMDEVEAVTLWLLKRARETLFDLVGLAYLTRRMGPQRRQRVDA